MPHSKKWKKELYKARGFVERETGRGTTTAKVTYNRNTLKAAAKKSAAAHGLEFPRFFNFLLKQCDGMKIPLNKSGNRRLVYLARKDPALAVHEFTHIAYDRITSLTGRNGSHLMEEFLAGSLELEWMMVNNEIEYEKRMQHKEGWVRKWFSKLFGRPLTKTIKGREIAIELQKRFSAAQRIELREKLFKMNFATEEDAQDYLEKYVAGNAP